MRDYTKPNIESKNQNLGKEESERIGDLEKELVVMKNELDQIKEKQDENRNRFDCLDRKIDNLDRNMKETINMKIDNHERASSDKIDELFNKFASEREKRLINEKDLEIEFNNLINKIENLDNFIEDKGQRNKERKLWLVYPILVAIVTVIANSVLFLIK